MKENNRFTVAVHILSLIALRQESPAASEEMALSVGIHPVAVRQAMSSLKRAEIIETQNGIAGGRLCRTPSEITLYDIYSAVTPEAHRSVFHFHPRPNPKCPVGSNIKAALHIPLARAQEAMENSLKAYSLADVTSFILEQYALQTTSCQGGQSNESL